MTHPRPHASPQIAPVLPAFLEDETVYSLGSRIHHLCLHGSARLTSRLLFGGDVLGRMHDFPGGLRYLARMYREESHVALALRRTALGFYAPFRSSTLIERCIESLGSSSVASVKFILGLPPSGLGAEEPLKACPHCMAEDLAVHGSTYWRRLHQCASNWICRRHRALLQCTFFKSRDTHRLKWLLPQDIPHPAWESPLIRLTPLLVRMSEVTRSMLDMPLGALTHDRLRALYQYSAAQQGLLTRCGRVRGEFSQRLGDELATLNALPGWDWIDSKKSTRFCLGMVRAGRHALHPAKHVAALSILFKDIHEIEITLGGMPQERPWHVDRPERGDDPTKELDLDVVRSTYELTGSVRRTSERLSLSYYQVERILTDIGIPIRRRPKALHPYLLAQLRQAFAEGRSIKEAAQLAAISPRLVERALCRQPALKQAWRDDRRERKTIAARQSFLSLVRSNEGASLSTVRRLRGNSYSWLYRNDSAWLSENVRAIFPAKHLSSSSRTRDS
ncbi:TnsD family Tn7-like transposition protein [Cupriavidus sp. 8B]